MADETAQSYANHTRYFPIFQFFAAPILTIQAFLETSHLIRSPNRGQFWETLVAWALAVGLFSARAMAIRAQDRRPTASWTVALPYHRRPRWRWFRVHPVSASARPRWADSG